MSPGGLGLTRDYLTLCFEPLVRVMLQHLLGELPSHGLDHVLERTGFEQVRDDSVAPVVEPNITTTSRPSRRNRIQCLQSQASARARRNALSRALRVSVAAAVNSERASASRPARNRKSPLAAGNGA